MKNAPCKENGIDCQDRHVGCHAECEKYKAWKADVDKANENRWAYKEQNASVWNKRVRKKK